MFGIEPSELLLVALVALVVIGPKDLPKAMRVVGFWVGKARGVARQFRSGFDEIVREAELEEMEKRWAKENERIMRDHPQPAADQPAIEHVGSAAPLTDDRTVTDDRPVMTALPAADHAPTDQTADPVHVEKPVVAQAPPTDGPRPAHDGAPS